MFIQNQVLQEEFKLKSQEKSIILFLFGRGSQAELKPNRCMALRQAEDFKWAQVPRFFLFLLYQQLLWFLLLNFPSKKKGETVWCDKCLRPFVNNHL